VSKARFLTKISGELLVGFTYLYTTHYGDDMKLNRKHIRKLILQEMADMQSSGRPDENLIKAIFYHMHQFLSELGPAVSQYGGQLGGLQMGHIKKLDALTDQLRGCAVGEVPEPWAVCAQPVFDMLVQITQMVNSGMTDRYLNAPAERGGLIALLQLSIQQANR